MTKFYSLVKRFLPVLFLVSCYTMVLGQERAVSGKVTSADDGSSVPGVNILEKGTNNGTVTDLDGNFKLNVGTNAVLIFSFVGYATQEVTVGQQSVLTVSMQSEVTALSEIVVVGYGEVQKKDATGAVVNMSNKDFNRGVIGNPQELIVGKFAGVQVTSEGGAPGSASTIRVRGGSSLSASNDPLIVIDGYPVDNSSQSGIPNALANLNPNDIETFTVLKDASATAIYGSRASNGVIIITTKKGPSGKTVFSYNGNTSMSSPIKFVDVMNAHDYVNMTNTLAQKGISGLSTPILNTKWGSYNTDWQNEIFRTAISSDHNISAAGTTGNMPFRASYGFTDQQGILKTTSMQRHSLNVNLNPSFLDNSLKLNLSAKGSYINNNFGDAGAVGQAVAFDPTQSPYDASAPQYGGYFSWLSKGSTQPFANPVAMLNQTDNRSKTYRIIANAQAEYTLPFMKELKATVNMGFDRSTSDGYNKAGTDAAFTASTSGTVLGRNNTYNSRNSSELVDIYLNYNKVFGDHKLDLTGGYGWQHFYREGNNTDSNLATTVTNGFRNENFLVSFFGRANYTFKGKYLLTATLRNDGSSRFAESNRWGLFPSVAVAWRMKDEAFLANAKVLSDLKLRAGYGQTGQQDIASNQYPYLPTYRSSNAQAEYQLGSSFYSTLRPDAYDANIKWETATTVNVGVDFGFLEDKITGSVELYQKNTSNLLNYVAVANGSNFSNYLNTNVGSIENKGLELSLNYTAISKKDVMWKIGFNYTAITSKITKLNLTNDPTYLGVFVGNIGVDAFIQNHQVGFPAFSYFTYQQVYDAAGKPIEGLYVDRSGQGGSVVGNSLNKYHYLKPAPDFLIGINSRLNVKNWDFSLSGRLSVGNAVYNRVQSGRAFYNNVYQLGYLSNVPTAINETNFVSVQQYSDFYVSDASFFKLDNLSAGYTFDRVFTDRLKARVSLTCTNVFIVTKYKGLDPEVSGGIDNNFYPRPRTLLLGVNLTF